MRGFMNVQYCTGSQFIISCQTVLRLSKNVRLRIWLSFIKILNWVTDAPFTEFFHLWVGDFHWTSSAHSTPCSFSTTCKQDVDIIGCMETPLPVRWCQWAPSPPQSPWKFWVAQVSVIIISFFVGSDRHQG